MDTKQIIQDLEAERDRLDSAIAALQGSRKGPGRPKALTNRKGGSRRLSATARKKIAESARRRWAKAKAAGKNSL